MEKEKNTPVKIFWKGTPSHWEYFMKYSAVGFLALVALTVSAMGFAIIGIPAFLIIGLYGLYLYYDIKLTNYTLTEEAILRKKGVFNRTTDELMLYRIQDISLEEPFFLRLVKLSNLKIYSLDASDPIFHLTSLKDGEKIRKAVRVLSEKQRTKMGVRPVDIVRNN